MTPELRTVQPYHKLLGGIVDGSAWSTELCWVAEAQSLRPGL